MRRKKWIAGFLITALVLSLFPVCAGAEAFLSGKVYYICSAMNENYVIDACQNGIFNETNLQLYPKKNSGANQRYMIVSVGGGWYKIVNMGANLVLDVYGNSSSSENLQLHAWNGGDNQLFKFEYAGNGYYYIKNKKGCYIDVSGGVCRSEQNIITYPLNRQKNQKWKFIPASSDNRMAIPEGTYTIHSKMNKNLVLDVADGSTANGALLELWSIKNDNTRNNQIFNVTANGSCYRLTDTNSGKSVDLYENKTVNCQPIGIWDSNNTDAQKYIFRSTNEGDGSFYIENVSGYVLDAEGGQNKAGTRIILYKKMSGAANQIWFLEKAAVSSRPTVSEPVNSVLSYDEKVSNFINDKFYKKGAPWGSGQKPRLSPYPGTGSERRSKI